MYSVRRPWYKTKWSLLVGLLFLPLWYTWKRTRRTRLSRTITGGCVAILFFTLILSVTGNASHSVPPAPKTVNSNAPSRPLPALSGYGATQAAWNASHTKDRSSVANTAYGPIQHAGDGYTDTYVSLLWTRGRALNYQMRFPDGTSILSAESQVMHQFPGDAQILWSQANTSDQANACYQMEVRSAVLGQILDTDGDTFVEFQSVTANGNIGYYASNVTSALLSNSDYKIADTAGSC